MEERMAALDTIGGGAVAERFAAELEAVLANIKDPNTQPTAKRKIVLEFVFQPEEDRERVHTRITARSILGALKPAGDIMYLAQHEGKMVATVVRHGVDPRQGALELVPRSVATTPQVAGGAE